MSKSFRFLTDINFLPVSLSISTKTLILNNTRRRSIPQQRSCLAAAGFLVVNRISPRWTTDNGREGQEEKKIIIINKEPYVNRRTAHDRGNNPVMFNDLY